MNLGKGLFRIWIVLSICWYGFVVERLIDKPSRLYSDELFLILLTPFAVLVVGKLTIWALQGFKK